MAGVCTNACAGFLLDVQSILRHRSVVAATQRPLVRSAGHDELADYADDDYLHGGPELVEPYCKGLRGTKLRYAQEVRDEANYFAAITDITLPDEMIEIAEHIIGMKTAPFDPVLLEDRYRTALINMLRDKQAQLPKPTG